MKKSEIKIITLANHGFLNFTKNSIASLERLQTNHQMKVYCVDDLCYNDLKQNYSECELIINEHNKSKSNLSVYPRSNSNTNSGFKDIMLMKYPAISDALCNYEYVLFIDSDVIFKDDRFLEYLTENIKDNDVLFQSETDGSVETIDPCAGLMFIQSNENTLNFFNVDTVVSDKNFIENVSDQDYVRKNKNKLKHDYMDVNLFPNGRYFQKYINEISPYMIHYNWCRPRQKIKIMRRTGGWFI